MKLKSYFSGTVEAAVELARRELGGDALLVHARPATPETRSLGAFEVVFGVETPAPGIESLTRPDEHGATRWGRSAATASDHPRNESEEDQGERPARIDDTRRHPLDRLGNEVAALRREIERMAESLRGARLLPSPAAQTELYTRLLESGLDADLALQASEGAALEELFETDATLGRPGAARAIAALVGPPGAGKTTTLIKLAAQYGLGARRPSRILSADVYRIAAADQLRSLASILGIGCDVLETPAALAQAIEEHRAKEFLFIDTPGLSAAEREEGADLARMFAAHPEIDTHLVLPASMHPEAMARAIDQYSAFAPRKIVFTRIDEITRFGSLLNESARHHLPLSFLCDGQTIPDDLEPASKDRLVQRITECRESMRSTGAAA